MKRTHQALGLLLAVLMPLVVVAGNLPYTFSSGSVIRASELNGNFEALASQLATLITPKSGTRIEVYAHVGTDSSVSPRYVGLYDRRLSTQCEVQRAEDGKLRCLPSFLIPLVTSAFAFTDPTCTIRETRPLFRLPVQVNGSYTELPPTTGFYATLGNGSVYNASQMTLFFSDSPFPDQAHCQPSDLPYVATGVVTATSFVEYTLKKI